MVIGAIMIHINIMASNISLNPRQLGASGYKWPTTVDYLPGGRGVV